jgi:glycosyltransferase involved in cell wall biosynthesis
MPFVSFIIVSRNAANHIRNLLNDYLRQDYPAAMRELIIVDGQSNDDTKEIATDFARQHPELAISILDNPKKTLAPGWNLGIKQARGDIVCRPDAHSSIPADYLRTGVQFLREHKADGVVCVGGPVQTRGKGFWGQAIAGVLSSPFGVGNSKFRYSKSPEYVDTVPFGFYWKWVFDQVGFFREDLDRNQDNELHARILKRGWKFFLAPQLETTYFCRSNITDLSKQAFDRGYWCTVTWRQCAWRHLVPFFFVAMIGILGLGMLFWAPLSYVSLVLGLSYLFLAYYFSYKTMSNTDDLLKILIMPGLFLLWHISYGLGSWWALLSGKFKVNK